MSDIYRFEITRMEGGDLHVHATIVHPDVDWVEDSKNLALQIILELYDNMKKGYIYQANWQSYPFTKEKAARMVASHPLAEQVDYWLRLQHGADVPCTEEEYKRISAGDVDKSNPRYQNISSYGFSNGTWHISYRPDYKAFIKVAELAILKVEQTNIQNMPWKHNQMSWEEREKITDEQWDEMYKQKPSCDLKITVINELLLHHVREGSVWQSAMYDFTYYAK